MVACPAPDGANGSSFPIPAVAPPRSVYPHKQTYRRRGQNGEFVPLSDTQIESDVLSISLPLLVSNGPGQEVRARSQAGATACCDKKRAGACEPARSWTRGSLSG